MQNLKHNKKPIILAVAHCLLSPEVRARGLSRHPEIKNKILKLAEKYNAEIKQLPCPEFLLLGEREPKTYDEYIETEGFRDTCEKAAEDFSGKVKDCKILIVGIARSPSCSDSYVHDRNDNLKKGKGLLIRFLLEKLPADTLFAEMDYHDKDGSLQKIREILENRL